jgi:hypothetical protein
MAPRDLTESRPASSKVNLELSADVSIGGASEKDSGYDSMSSGPHQEVRAEDLIPRRRQELAEPAHAEENRHGAHRGVRLQVLTDT